MSKQSEAKERQEYVDRPCACSNCRHFTSKIANHSDGWGHKWIRETEIRCGLGGFKVKKMGSCKEWSGR